MSDSTESPAGESPPLEPLGSRIRRLRSARGLGQERLAIEAGVDQSGLSKFERGRDMRVLGEASVRRVATVLQVSFEELVSGTDYRRR
jgi:transcriptional regulator with XRE-family HTH domain